MVAKFELVGVNINILQMLMKVSDHDSKEASQLYPSDQLTSIFSMLT